MRVYIMWETVLSWLKAWSSSTPMLRSALDGWSMSCLSWRDEPMELPKLNRHHYTDTKGEGNPTLYDGCRSTTGSMHQTPFSLPLSEISHHTGIFRTVFLFPRSEFFPPWRNFPFIFPFPGLDFTAFIYIPGKLPSLLTEGIPGLPHAKKTCGCQ